MSDKETIYGFPLGVRMPKDEALALRMYNALRGLIEYICICVQSGPSQYRWVNQIKYYGCRECGYTGILVIPYRELDHRTAGALINERVKELLRDREQ